MSVAEIIFQQLGGRRFAVVTGSKILASTEDTLIMTLARNKSGANRLSIKLDWNDTYTVRFFKYSKPSIKLTSDTAYPIQEKVKDIEVLDNVYCDELQDIFERVTGLDLSLCRVYYDSCGFSAEGN